MYLNFKPILFVAFTLQLFLRCKSDCGVGLSACGQACYSPSEYQCYGGSNLCILSDQICGTSCYDPQLYSCNGNALCSNSDPSCVAQQTATTGGGSSATTGKSTTGIPATTGASTTGVATITCSPISTSPDQCICGQETLGNPAQTSLSYWQSKAPGVFNQTTDFVVWNYYDSYVVNGPIVERSSWPAACEVSGESYEKYTCVSANSYDATTCTDAGCTDCTQSNTISSSNVQCGPSVPLPTKGHPVLIAYNGPNCEGQVSQITEYYPDCDIESVDQHGVATYGAHVCDSSYVYYVLSAAPTCNLPLPGLTYTYPVGVCENSDTIDNTVVSQIYFCAGC